MIDDSPPEPVSLGDFEKMMAKCREFYQSRGADGPDPIPADSIRNSKLWDFDLKRMTREDLLVELYAIQSEIKTHRDIKNRRRTIFDDRQLYKILPERVTADFRLPPRKDFLGEAKAPDAGCLAFWKSHSRCVSGTCNLHKWGLCPP